MRIHSVFRLIFLVIVALSVMPVVTGSSSPNTRIYLDPSDYIFDSGTVSTGYKFNITLRVGEVVDLVAWQVKMYYNDSIINVTRWFEPTWDSDYVFYGKATFAAPIQPDCAYNHVGPGNGSTQVGAILLPLPPNQTSFNGSGKLCILEFIVTAIPSDDETLSCLLSINNPDTFLLETDGSVISNVTKEDGYYELHTVVSPDMHTLTITTTSGGTTDPSPGEYSYSAGTQVQVSAIPDTNNLFDHWELDGENAGTVNPIEVLMNSNHTLHTIFSSLTYNLTVSTTAGGTTDPTPGTYTYVNGTIVSIIAAPGINHKFEYWILDGANAGADNPINILMDSNHNLQAVFTQITYQLTVTTTTGGTTNPEPSNYTHVNGTVVPVTAIPDANYVFDHWKLDDSNIGSDNPVDILMDANHTMLAVFALRTYTLTITSTAKGTTDPTPETYNYSAGSSANVTAIPSLSYSFDHWLLDGEERTENPITIQMDTDHTLNAVFNPILYYLSIYAVERPSGTTDPPVGTHSYITGTTLNVTALPDPGFSFDYWSLDGEKRIQDSITIVMNMNHTLIPYFVDSIPPKIDDPTQEPPENVMAYQNVTVTANVTDLGTGVHNVTLWYSINNGTTWTPLKMIEITTDTYQATIPGYESCTLVRYRIIAYDNNGNQAINDNQWYYYIQACMHANKLNRSIAFLVGAFIIIISGVFLLLAKAYMHE